MTPLILRPQPAADELAARLRQDGHTPLVCPLVSYQPGNDLSQLPTQLSLADLCIAVSVAAVEYATREFITPHQPWPTSPTYLAVGNATAQAWQKTLIHPVITPADARSEGLLALPELIKVTGKRIVILRGNGGRELLGQTLQQRGAEVHYLECYRRHYLQTDGQRLLQEWQAAKVDSVIITSSELFRHLCHLLPEHDTTRVWLATLHWFAASERIAEEIRNSGIKRITIMAGAHHAAVASALSE